MISLNIAGTQNGQYYNTASTGKYLSAKVAIMGLGDNGTVAENCTVEDGISMLEGMGVISFNESVSNTPKNRRHF